MKERQQVPVFLLLFAALVFYWYPALSTGYSFEDSWFLEYRKFSLVDVFVWFTEPRDFLGYYRPVRKLFFAIPNLFFRVPSPELYHGLLLGSFLLMLFYSQRLYRQIIGQSWIPLFAAAAFGLAGCHIKPLAWLSASHNILAALFCAMALFYRAKDRRIWSAGFFSLAIASRETSVGLVLALVWIAYSQTPPSLRWSFYLKRSWESWLIAMAFSLFFLWQPALVEDQSGILVTSLPLWLVHWLGYLLVFISPTKDNLQQFIVNAPLLFPFVAFLFSLICAFGFWRQLRNRELSAVFGWAWVGGLGVHLVYLDRWNQEYATIAGIGFFGFCATWTAKAFDWNRRFAIFISALVTIWVLFVAQENRPQLEKWQQSWMEMKAWVQSFEDFQRTFAAKKVLVIAGASTFSGDEQQAAKLVLLPQYLRISMPKRVVYWDTKRLPWAAHSHGIGHRSFTSKITRSYLEDQDVVYVKEESLRWTVIENSAPRD